jgi:hypothetical protein
MDTDGTKTEVPLGAYSVGGRRETIFPLFDEKEFHGKYLYFMG